MLLGAIIMAHGMPVLIASYEVMREKQFVRYKNFHYVIHLVNNPIGRQLIWSTAHLVDNVCRQQLKC